MDSGKGAEKVRRSEPSALDSSQTVLTLRGVWASRTEHDLHTPLSEQERRRLSYAAAHVRDCDDFAFGS
jgi:hypothetical protein